MFLRVNGLFGHIRRNDIRSVSAFLGFAVAIQIMAAGVLLVPLLFFDARRMPLLNPGDYLLVYGSIVLLATCAIFIWRYDRYMDDMEDALGFGAGSLGDARLRRVVEEMALTAGIKCPRTAIVESKALNAFACGTKPENSVVVATRGLLETLDDRELRAVVAHEITHIKNGDIRFMASSHVLFGILVALRHLNKFKLKKTRRNWFAVAVPALYIFPAMASAATGIAFMIGRATRSGISLSREFIADAEAVRLSQDAGALVSALRKVDGRSRIDGLRPEFEAMMIDGASRGTDPTHPPIAERIAALLRLAGPMAAEAYSGAGGQASRPAFGRKGAGSPFMQPQALAFAGSAAGERTAEEEFVRDFFDRSPEKTRANNKMTLIAFPIIFALFYFISGTLPEPTSVQTIGPDDAALVREQGCFPRYVQIGSPDSYYPVTYRQTLIDDYRRGDRSTSDIDFERYLAWHRKTITNVRYAGADADADLVEYARMRKLNLEQAHDLFGPSGFEAMQAEYRSKGDREVLDRLQERLKSPAPLPLKDEVSMADLTTLATAPDRFLPCRSLRNRPTS